MDKNDSPGDQDHEYPLITYPFSHRYDGHSESFLLGAEIYFLVS